MIRFADADDVTLDELIVEVRSRGACDIVAGGRTKERALRRFAETLRFPSWFGHNLDALYELLDEHAHAVTASGRDWTLIWSPSRHLVTDHPSDYARVLGVLSDVADASTGSVEGVHGSRLVVVHGAGLAVPAGEPQDPRPDPHSPEPQPERPTESA